MLTPGSEGHFLFPSLHSLLYQPGLAGAAVESEIAFSIFTYEIM